MTGLETHIFQQCRFGEGIFGYRVSVVNTLPPPEKCNSSCAYVRRVVSATQLRQA